MRLKKDDTVMIIAGKDKGLTGRIVKVDPASERVYVQGANMVKKTMKKRNAQDKGGIVEVEAPIHISNVALIDPKSKKAKKPVRVGFDFENGKKIRVCHKTGSKLD